MSDQNTPVVITLRDVYEAISAMRNELTRMQSDHQTQTQAVLVNTARIIDHEGRIRSLEKWAWSIPAAAILAAGGVIGSVVAIFAK